MLKALFISGVLLGFAVVIAAAGFYPWIDHPRGISRTEVRPNGGRHEAFIVRLPDDRIASLAPAGAGGSAAEQVIALPPELSGSALQIDHFKVRDIAGDVIGVAARHALELPGGPAITWSITVPARGALHLVGGPSPAEGGDAQLFAGTIAGGSREFASLSGEYLERWQVTGVDPGGNLQATIELDTTGFIVQ